MGTAFCPNCGAPVQPHISFCATCGAKIASSSQPSRTQQSYYGPAPGPQPPVSTGPYKAAIAVLLLIIIILGIGYYEASAGHLPFSLGTNRYQLANPPNSQSIQPPNTSTPPPGPTIWNSCGAGSCIMQTNGWREGTVPDTYDYFVSFTSNVSITVYFFTLGQFVQYAVCNGDLTCVSGSHVTLSGTTNRQNTVFKLAEGCADYVAIYVASANGVMTPNVKVAQNAAPYATGYCAQAGN